MESSDEKLEALYCRLQRCFEWAAVVHGQLKDFNRRLACLESKFARMVLEQADTQYTQNADYTEKSQQTESMLPTQFNLCKSDSAIGQSKLSNRLNASNPPNLPDQPNLSNTSNLSNPLNLSNPPNTSHHPIPPTLEDKNAVLTHTGKTEDSASVPKPETQESEDPEVHSIMLLLKALRVLARQS